MEFSLDMADNLIWIVRTKTIAHKLLDMKAKAAMGLHKLALDRAKRAALEASFD